jgi:peptide/nickel transport system permease protein
VTGSTLVFDYQAPERRRQVASAVRRLIRSPSGVAGTLMVALLVAAGFGASWFMPYDPAVQDLGATLRPPSLSPIHGRIHFLGTDQLGRDVLSRLFVGLRISLLLAFVVVPVSMVLGTAGGIVSGYYGGQLDLVIMRVVDAQLAIPTLLLMIAVVAVLGSGLVPILLTLVIAGGPTYTLVLRTEALSLRHREFLSAATATGTGDGRILLRHVLPNVLPTAMVLATLQLPTVIIWEASLSFLGLGIQPPTPSLGAMLGQSQEVVWQAWWMPMIPGVAITLVVLGFNLIGDRVRDILDPRLRGVGPS